MGNVIRILSCFSIALLTGFSLNQQSSHHGMSILHSTHAMEFDGLSAIVGTVSDAFGSTMAGANIYIPELATPEGGRGAAVGEDNCYTISDVPPGKYTLRATFLGYRTHDRKNLVVQPNQLIVVDFVLDTARVQLIDGGNW
jgi:hypothetical protein